MTFSGVLVELRNVHYEVNLSSSGWLRRTTTKLWLKSAKDSPPDMDAESGGQSSRSFHFSATDDENVPIRRQASASSAKESRCGFQKDKLTILSSISASILPGEALAIIGPSGSGKTSLLNLIAGRSEYRLAAGQISYNGHRMDAHTRQRIGYVMQDDVFFSNLTVRQTLEFTASIRLSDTLTRDQIRSIAHNAAARLRLEKCLDTRIGDQQFSKGISGGERKRANIANELLPNPAILLLDEPTSGLDASTAMLVVRSLREIARAGATVVFTIHQPSSEMLEHFDKVMLLCEGRVVFFGPSNEVQGYFTSLGYSFPLHYNPFDFLMKLLTENVAATEMEDQTRPAQQHLTAQEKLIRLWKLNSRASQSTAYETSNEIETKMKADRPREQCTNTLVGCVRRSCQKIFEHSLSYPASWCRQVWILGRRSLLEKRYGIIESSLLLELAMIILIVSIFWFQIANSELTIDDRLGVLFFISMFWSYFAMFEAVFAFPSEWAVVSKDTDSAAYRLSAYYCAKTLVEMPTDCIYPVVFSVIVYWIVGFNQGVGSFFTFTVILVVIVLTSQSIGLTISAATMDVRQSTVLSSSLILASLLMTGYFVESKSIPRFIYSLRYLSFLKYGYDAFARNELLDQVYTCVLGPNGHSVYSLNGSRCPVRGADVLFNIRMERSLSVIGNLGVLMLWNLLVRIVGFICLKFRYNARINKV